MRQSVHVLIHGANGRLKLSLVDGLFEFLLCRQHQGRMERAAHGQHKGTLRAGLFQLGASSVDGFFRTGDDELARAVVVGRHYHARLFAHGGADFFNLLVGQGDYGSHTAGVLLAGLLHGERTLRHEAQTILETQAAGGGERGEFAERMTCHHVGLESVAEAECAHHAVQEHSGLRHLRLLQFLVRALEHDVRDAETEDFVCLFKILFGYRMLFVQVFSHAHELCALSGKYKCVHKREEFDF